MYWRGKSSHHKTAFYKTQDEWEEETALSKYAQRKAREILSEHDWWGEERKGVPAKLWYDIDRDAMEAAFDKWQESQRNAAKTSSGTVEKLESAGCQNKSCDGAETNTETTSENTSTVYPEGAHAREDEPTDTELNDAQPTYSQEPVGWLMHFAAQQGYELAINQAQSVVMRLAQRGLSDGDEQDYLVDKLGQAIAQDRPPGKFAHYVGNRRDVEQWQGEGKTDGKPSSKGRSLMERLREQGIK
jgi:hypothetical protein